MLLTALHLVASRVLKQQNFGALANSIAMPGSALQELATTTCVSHVTVHQPDFATLALPACIHHNLLCCGAQCCMPAGCTCSMPCMLGTIIMHADMQL
jgi:hypothetical protein